MTLVIDCFKLVMGAGKSIGIYNLTKSLAEYLAAENVRRGNEQNILILGNTYNRKDFDLPGLVFIQMEGNPLSRAAYTWWELEGVSAVLKRYMPDNVLFPRGYTPLHYSGRKTIIIHDLIPFFYKELYPESVSKAENLYITKRLLASIRSADRVITISDYSREDIIRRVPGSEKKIVKIYNGLNDMEVPRNQEAGWKGSSYVAAVTSSLPHKNAQGIMKAYDRYHTKCHMQGLRPLQMKVIGVDREGLHKYESQQLISHQAAQDVDCCGYVRDHKDYCRILHGAQFFLFLSYIEGFGFPPLEAMQLECPVISSDRTSLKEVIGNAGICVDPDKIEDVADQMIYLQTHPQTREELVRRGSVNVKRFGWDSRIPLYWDALFNF